ncbi:hypothetical protein [Dechloromonas hortensis]|uniref:hypothetical protein n=1 Tax=Dechloromonas hortensis TaxID=337779 RepID=UPI0012926BDA|nr:hypothetical protein [Dechloromonas hortensis]
MSKEAAVQPAQDEVKASKVATPVVEKSEPVTVQTAVPEPKKQVATAAAVKKVAAKPKVEKKVVAAKPAKKEVAEKSAPAPALKTPAKPVKKAPVAAKEKVAEAPKAEKAPKVKQVPKKPKLVRDSFTIPETDYALFATLKQRALAAGVEVKKGEILRAAVVALAKLDDAELVKAIGLVERIKTGRPKK